MKKTIFRIFLLCFITVLAVVANAQNFSGEINAFKKKDAVSFPAKNAILFTGSSSFTKWQDVQEYFPGTPIINRGFGGSSLTHLIQYENDIIFPYHPKQIVIYCGENDIASDDDVTGEIVAERFIKLFKDIRRRLPGTQISFVSMKPSPSRWHMRERMMEGNKRIKKYLKKKSNTDYINVWNAMLGTDGKPIQALFVEDNLHMNASGYAIWQKIIAPYLLK